MKHFTNRKAAAVLFEGFCEGPRKNGFGDQFTPRQRRLAAALARGRWVSREEVDAIAGASNGPEVVRQLRCRVTGHDGLEMRMVAGVDRDGFAIKYGQYRLTDEGKRRAILAGLLGASDGERA